MDAIEGAFNRWFQCASAHPDNIAIFYFCGHGVLKGTETGLLAADFAAPAYVDPVRNAIHVEGTVQGMLRCKANKQLSPCT